MIAFLRVLRPIAAIVLFFVSWQFLMVSEFVAWAKEPARPQPVAHRASVAEKFGRMTDELEELLEKVHTALDSGQDISEHHTRIIAVSDELETLNTGIEEEFAATGKKIDEIGAAPVIHERQKKALAAYREKFKEIRQLLGLAKQHKAQPSGLKKDAEDLAAFLKVNKPKTRHIPLDPNNLPNRAAKPKKILPKQTPEEYEKDERFRPRKKQHGWNQVLPKDGVKIASADGDLRGLFTVAQATQPVGIPAPTPEDLAPTVDAQLTDAIRAKAAELGGQPLPIYQWVRNNIEFVPTYGSIQGADYCLQTKQCNAFDTASLLIALLRAAGIHARYLYGTIEIPADKAMNWVGGVTKPELAVQLLNMGGVPAVAVVEGSQITKVRLEHVWVEGWIDYVPSRGAVHRQGDNWIVMDPSWKQYTYTDSIDFAAAVPFDAQGFVDRLTSTATVNEAEGWAAGIDTGFIGQQISSYEAQTNEYLSRNLPSGTVGDVLGKKTIIPLNLPLLASSLPYARVALAGRYAELQSNLRYSVTIEGVADSGEADFSKMLFLPQVAGNKIILSYEPATEADQSLIERYFTEGATAIPSYLVTYVPRLKVGGVTVVQGSPLTMGNQEVVRLLIYSPASGPAVYMKAFTSGEVGALMIHTGRIGAEVLERERGRSSDWSDPVGEMLHAILLSYWGELNALATIPTNLARVTSSRLPSCAWAVSSETVEFLFGYPFQSSYQRREIDVLEDLQVVVSRDGNRDMERKYRLIAGATSSALEGIILDQLFSERIGEGVSAFALLAHAYSAGMRVYELDRDNIDAVLPGLDLDSDVKEDIRNAAYAGLVVKVPASGIDHNGWHGSGYVILDPETGAGRYMISGGLRGGTAITGNTAVVPLPQVPITGGIAFVLNLLAYGAGLGFVETKAALSKVAGGSSMALSIAIPAPGANPSVSGSLGLAAIVLMIFDMVRNLADQQRVPPVMRRLRHYTQLVRAISIAMSRYINASVAGDLGPGVYLTDILDEPTDPTTRASIASRLRMSYDNTEAYVELDVDMARVPLATGASYPNQFCYVSLRPFGLLIDGTKVGFVKVGP